ncbi:MAG: cytochrome C oxidase subunit IV family protein [Acidobacteria bacterium]|nr:cytochrome C oxidase subunit IV family protein [Acidobacteriota bacterium]
MSEHVVSPKVYLLILTALLVGTAATVWVAQTNLGPLNLAVALTIAVIKATLVVLFFMHMKYSHRLNWIFFAAAIIWLILLISMTLVDVLARLAGN